MATRWAWTDEATAMAVTAYHNGKSAAQIGRELGVASSTVYRHLDKCGIIRDYASRELIDGHRRKFDQVQVDEIIKLYRTGEVGGRELARRFDCSDSTIYKLLRQHGIALLPRGGQGKRIPVDTEARIVELGAALLSQFEIAKQCGVSQTKVSAVLRKHGMRRRQFTSGVITTTEGYRAVRVAHDHPYAAMAGATNYIPEHRLVMAEALGRPLHRWETVHHVNGDRLDNRLTNLQLRIGKHGKGQVYRCADCGSFNIVPAALEDTI